MNSMPEIVTFLGRCEGASAVEANLPICLTYLKDNSRAPGLLCGQMSF